MKKILIILLALSLVFCFAACGGGDNPADKPADNPEQAEEQTYVSGEDLAQQAENLNKNNLTAAEVAQIEADAAAEGYVVTWEEDGSLSVTEDGVTATLTTTWPDNDYTKSVPAPSKEGSIGGYSEEEGMFIIGLAMTVDEVKAYAAELKAAGFDQAVEEQDMADLKVYTYTAQNKDGVTVMLVIASDNAGLSITK